MQTTISNISHTQTPLQLSAHLWTQSEGGNTLAWQDPRDKGRREEERAWASNPHRKLFFLSPALLYGAGRQTPQPNHWHRYGPAEGQQTTFMYQQQVCWQLWFRSGTPQRVCEKLSRTSTGIEIRAKKCPGLSPCNEAHTVHTVCMDTHSPDGTGKGWPAGIKVKVRGRVRRWGQRKLERRVKGGIVQEEKRKGKWSDEYGGERAKQGNMSN